MNSVEPFISAPGFKAKQVYEQIADAIRSGIVSGAFPDGSRLPSERELALRFGVSRPAVREAIGALQNEGYVLTRHGSGTYVTWTPRPDADTGALAAAGLVQASVNADISPTSILDVRMLIEPAIARLAARHKQRDPLAEQYLQQMSDVRDIDDPAQQAAWNTADSMFHRQLAVMTRDALVVKIADEIAKSMDQRLWQRLRDDGIYDHQRIQLYVAEHRLIYEAVVLGDGDAAAFYIEGHLKRVRADIATRD
ncbi:FadR/GntR family transcriptional regulator [Xylophilus sp. GOD-11R]|uniref:FadR/GntR family transcriptional regulator n=1 Tax=Xylophilus sp. GOD-11R TaxID=3089814 RepID=UPI00298C463F|nr:FadR/GntR family transcriptional regulator [Xylophilus sp. GOD-11R]WPB55202.1 FadR/GntR family transcriptional regulator [Xylophilus sp. GOD-11R]